MRVVFIASECEPFAKTGGLGDVVDALARALSHVNAPEGTDGGALLERPVDVYLPRYRNVHVPEDALAELRYISVPQYPLIVAELISFYTRGYRLRLVDCPELFGRNGIYGDGNADFPDNAARFGFLAATALMTIEEEGEPVDVIHVHDWQGCPALLQRAAAAPGSIVAQAASVLTLHNLAYHGWTPAHRIGELGAPASVTDRVRAGDGLDLLEAGIRSAEMVNTVSPGFAVEARTPEFGMGLDGLLTELGPRFCGILNGLDPELWNPATDPALAAHFWDEQLDGKAACRRALAAELGLDAPPDAPILSIVSRFDPQKGIDLVAEAADRLLELGARLVVLGSGDSRIADPFHRLAEKHPKLVAVRDAFDRNLSRRIYAGSDLFLMPSRFEPCGQSQMIALRYGTPPIVRRTGGLADTVIDADESPDQGTGWVFDRATPEALLGAATRAIATFRATGDAGRARREAIIKRAMTADFAWESGPVREYASLYRRAIAERERTLEREGPAS